MLHLFPINRVDPVPPSTALKVIHGRGGRRGRYFATLVDLTGLINITSIPSLPFPDTGRRKRIARLAIYVGASGETEARARISNFTLSFALERKRLICTRCPVMKIQGNEIFAIHLLYRGYRDAFASNGDRFEDIFVDPSAL